MTLYWYADLTVSSCLPLAEHLTAKSEDQEPSPDFAFCLLAEPPPEPAGIEWIRHWYTEAGDLSLSLARKSDEFLLRFPYLADFVISGDGRQIAAWPTPATDRETLCHLLLDQVLPRLLAHQGRLVLHASAVRVDGRTIAFAGESGRGKSTLAMSLHTAGFPLLSDDGLVVAAGESSALALPIYPGLRLWPPSIAAFFVKSPPLAQVRHYSAKQRVVLPENSAPVSAPLAALYLLAARPPYDAVRTITVSPLSPRDACVELIRHSFLLDVSDPRRAAGLLAAAGSVAAQLPVFVLIYPRVYSCLPAVRAAILQYLEHHADVALGNSRRG
jgi:hypothetical protein